MNECRIGHAAPGKGDLPEIPGYRLESELGHGPFGAVYQAVREADEAVVAIKTYVAASPPSRDDAMAFLNDAAPLRDMTGRPVTRRSSR